MPLTVTDETTPNGNQVTASPSAPAQFSFGSANQDALDRYSSQYLADQSGNPSQSATGGVTPAKTPTTVPLWQVRPGVPVGRTGANDIITTVNANNERAAYHVYAGVPVDQAQAAFLDMTQEERDLLRLKLIAAQTIKPDATDEQVMAAWMKWVTRAVQYNTGRPVTEYISPWEAIDKLAVQHLAGEGAKADTTQKIHKIDQTESHVQVYTLSDLQQAAEAIMTQTLGRGPTKDELARYRQAVNDAAAKSPVVSHTTGTVDTSTGREVKNTTTTGGIDPNQVMTDMARQNPEFAAFQGASTYFGAAMDALNSVLH